MLHDGNSTFDTFYAPDIAYARSNLKISVLSKCRRGFSLDTGEKQVAKCLETGPQIVTRGGPHRYSDSFMKSGQFGRKIGAFDGEMSEECNLSTVLAK